MKYSLCPKNVDEIWGSGKRPLGGGLPGEAAEGGEDRRRFLHLQRRLGVQRGCSRWLRDGLGDDLLLY